jgi:hypothetical protein
MARIDLPHVSTPGYHPQGMFLNKGTQTEKTNLGTLIIPKTVTQYAAD